MTDSRRDIFKKIGMGAVWSTPIVQSVLLPVHAQTSATTTPPTLSCNISSPTVPNAVGDGVIDGVVEGQVVEDTQVKLLPPIADVKLLLTITNTDNPVIAPVFETLMAITDSNGVAMFGDWRSAGSLGGAYTAKFTCSLDPTDNSGVTLSPCSILFSVASV